MKKYSFATAEKKPQLDNQPKQPKKLKQPGFAIKSGLKASFSSAGY